MSSSNEIASEAPKPLWYLMYHGEVPEGAYEQRFNSDFIDKVAKFCGGKVDRDALVVGIAKAVHAFVSAKHNEEFFKSEKAENMALDKVANAASALHDALLGLYDYGQTSKKLVREIESFERFTESMSPRVLVGLLRRRGNPLLLLQDLATDIAVAAENATNRKPKLDPEAAMFYGDKYPARLSAEKEKWRARHEQHKLMPNHAVAAFLKAFKPVWEGQSKYPFTEGMHFKETGETASAAVDAALLILHNLEVPVQRSKVVTAMRELRRQGDKI